MMAFLARRTLPAAPAHSDYANFTAKLNTELAQGRGVDSDFAQKHGRETVRDALSYDTHLSAKTFAKQLDVVQQYRAQDVEFGHQLYNSAIPDGWALDTQITHRPDETVARTSLASTQGQRGFVEFSRHDNTLILHEEYKNSLPTVLTVHNEQGTLKAPTMALISQHAIRQLVDADNPPQQFKVSRLQHQMTVAHVDWLTRNGKAETIESALPHTVWFQRIKGMAAMSGLEIQGKPEIRLQGTPLWTAAHPEAALRDWNYIADEPINISLGAITGKPLPDTDSLHENWRDSAHVALGEYMNTLPETDKAPFESRLDNLALTTKNLEARYDLPASGPRHINYDIIFDIAPFAENAVRSSRSHFSD